MVAQVTDGKAVLKLAYLASDQIGLGEIYLLFLLRISLLIILLILAVILCGPDW